MNYLNNNKNNPDTEQNFFDLKTETEKKFIGLKNKFTNYTPNEGFNNKIILNKTNFNKNLKLNLIKPITEHISKFSDMKIRTKKVTIPEMKKNSGFNIENNLVINKIDENNKVNFIITNYNSSKNNFMNKQKFQIEKNSGNFYNHTINGKTEYYNNPNKFFSFNNFSPKNFGKSPFKTFETQNSFFENKLLKIKSPDFLKEKNKIKLFSPIRNSLNSKIFFKKCSKFS